MQDTNVPLNPFPGPSFSIPGSSTSGSFEIAGFLPVILTIAFGIWVLYTLAAIYHWFRYGHQSWIAVPAIALHVLVSGVIFIYAISGLG